MNTTQKTGDLVALDAVSDNDDILITTRQGIVVRTHVDGISQTSRATQGVKIITLKDNTEIASIAVVDKEDDEEEIVAENTEALENANAESSNQTEENNNQE
jgi:DNA gyrase subunit A